MMMGALLAAQAIIMLMSGSPTDGRQPSFTESCTEGRSNSSFV